MAYRNVNTFSFQLKNVFHPHTEQTLPSMKDRPEKQNGILCLKNQRISTILGVTR